MSKEFHIFKQNTEAIATNRGFYYQYLKTVKLWLDNYMNGVDHEIYCEREDDIFEHHSQSKTYKFRQIKCYSTASGLNSLEVKSSLLNFYMLYLKYDYKGLFYFESNTTIQPRAGKNLTKWIEQQQKGDFSATNYLEDVKEIFKDYIQERLEAFLKDKTKEEHEEAKQQADKFFEGLNEPSFEKFLESIRWVFSNELDTYKAIANLSEEILTTLDEKIKYDNRVNKELLLGYLVNVVLEKSIEGDEEKRLLTNKLLQEALVKTEIDETSFDKDIKLLLDDNFFIKEKLESIETTGIDTNKMLMKLVTELMSGQTKSSLEMKYKLNIKPPLLSSKISKRETLVNLYINKLEKVTHLHIQGSKGMGKTQLSNLIVQKIDSPIYWFRVKNFENEVKSLLVELNNIILERSNNNFFIEKLNIEQNSIIVLDDLPSSNGNNFDTEIIELIYTCQEHNIKIISNSNYTLSSNLRYQYSNLIDFINIPNFSEDETKELLKIYDAPSNIYQYSVLINTFSDNHPWLIVPTIHYLKSKDWDIDFTNFFKNEFVDNELDKFQSMLKSYIEDDTTRELVYRLNIIGKIVYEDEIKLISSTAPSIKNPFERLNTLLDIFIYKEDEKQYVLSPLLYKLGSKNLNLDVEKNINRALGISIIKKEISNQYQLMKGITYFLHAEEFDMAGHLLFQGLHSLITSPIKEIEYSNLYFTNIWEDMPLPNQMKIETQLLIRTCQLIIYSRQNKNIDKLYKDYLLLESKIKKDSIPLFSSYMMLYLYSENKEDYSSKLFKMRKNLPKEITEVFNTTKMPPQVNEQNIMFESIIFGDIEYVNSIEKLQKWLNTLNEIEEDTLKKVLEQDIAKIGLNGLVLIIGLKILDNNTDSEIKKVYTLLKNFSDSILSTSLDNLYTSIRVSMLDCLLRLNNLDGAVKLFNETLLKVEDKDEYKLILSEKLAKKYLDMEKYDKAHNLYINIVDIKTTIYKDKLCDVFVYMGIVLAKKEQYLDAKEFFEKALDFYPSLDYKDNTYLAKIYGEYSIVLWKLDLPIKYLIISDKLLSLFKHSMELNEAIKAVFMIYANNLGYCNSIVTRGIPPKETIDGDKYTFAENRNFFYHDTVEVAKLYDAKKEYFAYYHFMNMAYVLNQKILAKKYLAKLLEKPIDAYNWLIQIDCALGQRNYQGYFLSIKTVNNPQLFLIPLFIQIHIDLLNGINNLSSMKQYFIDELSEKLEKKYFDISIFVFDSLNKNVSKIETIDGSDWLVQRLHFFSKYPHVTILEALEAHTIISKDLFRSELSVIYTELQKREIFENYFFTFWIDKLDKEKSSFKYASIVKENVLKLYDDNSKAEEKVNKLLKMIEQYRKK